MVAAWAGIPRCTAIAEIRLALRAWVSVSTTLSPFTLVVHRPAVSSLPEPCRETPYQTPPTTRTSGTTTAAVRRRMLISSGAAPR